MLMEEVEEGEKEVLHMDHHKDFRTEHALFQPIHAESTLELHEDRNERWMVMLKKKEVKEKQLQRSQGTQKRICHAL